jgi:hypothetical protein
MIIYMDLKKKLGIYVIMNYYRNGLHSIVGFLVILKIYIINILVLIETLLNGLLNWE